MRKIYEKEYSHFFGKRNLNLGSAANLGKGKTWVNMDMNPKTGAEVIHDAVNIPWPFESDSFDCVLASHFFEHVEKKMFFPIMNEVHRILKVGGYMLAMTPHGGSDDSWENPMHLMNFSQHTWLYLFPVCYRKETLGSGADQGMELRPWTLKNIILIPYPEFRNDKDLDWKVKHYRNVIQEIHCILRKKGGIDEQRIKN